MQKHVSDVGPLQLADYGVQFVNFRTQAALTDGDVVFLSTSGYVGRAVATASGTMRGIGIAAGAASSGTPARIAISGPLHSPSFNFSGMVGQDLFAPTSAGAPTPIQPTASGQIVQIVGQATDQSGLVVQIQTVFQRGGATP